jgi:hypothetical protein
MSDEIDDSIVNEPHDWSQTRTLYVLLQGEFALYREANETDLVSDTLHIVAPNIPGHQYKAGPWLTDWKNQAELPCSPLRLRHAFGDRKNDAGQHSQRAIPESNLDIIMSLGQEAPDPEDARVHITARMPLAILPGTTETTAGKVIIDVKSNGGDIYPPVPANPTVIAILVYKWYAGKRPYLWSPSAYTKWLPGGPSEDFLSLHVYASSPCEEDEHDPGHAEKAFTAAAKLLGEEAYICFNDAKFIPARATPPAGLSFAQVNLLFSQVLRYDPCDPRLTLDDWYANNPYVTADDKANLESGGSSGNCGPITGGGGG